MRFSLSLALVLLTLGVWFLAPFSATAAPPDGTPKLPEDDPGNTVSIPIHRLSQSADASDSLFDFLQLFAPIGGKIDVSNLYDEQLKKMNSLLAGLMVDQPDRIRFRVKSVGRPNDPNNLGEVLMSLLATEAGGVHVQANLRCDVSAIDDPNIKEIKPDSVVTVVGQVTKAEIHKTQANALYTMELQQCRVVSQGPLDASAFIRGQPREVVHLLKGKFNLNDNDHAMQLDGDNHVATSEKFHAPVAFHMLAQVTDTNLRIAYAANQIIFDWEVNDHELRIDGGPIDGKHRQGAGWIPKSRWEAIDVVVQTDSLSLYVDGERRYHMKGDFSKTNQPFSIFHAGNGNLLIKSVLIGPPKDRDL